MNRTSLYIDTDSPLHRLSARATLALAVGFATAAYVFDTPLAIGTVFAIVFGSLIAVGGRRNVRRAGPILLGVFVAGLVIWPAYVPQNGPPLVAVASVGLSEYELRFALARSARIGSFLVVGLTFVTTTSNEEFVSGLRALGVPYVACFAIGAALRLFPTFLGTARTVRQAQSARGLDLEDCGPIGRIRRSVPLLIPVLMTALRRVEMGAMSLESRGFGARGQRTFYDRQPFRRRDWIAVAIGFLVAGGSIASTACGLGTL